MPARIHRLEFDRDDGAVIETGDGVLVEVVPYATWRQDGETLPDSGRPDAVRLGDWVVAVTRRSAF